MWQTLLWDIPCVCPHAPKAHRMTLCFFSRDLADLRHSGWVESQCQSFGCADSHAVDALSRPSRWHIASQVGLADPFFFGKNDLGLTKHLFLWKCICKLQTKRVPGFDWIPVGFPSSISARDGTRFKNPTWLRASTPEAQGAIAVWNLQWKSARRSCPTWSHIFFSHGSSTPSLGGRKLCLFRFYSVSVVESIGAREFSTAKLYHIQVAERVTPGSGTHFTSPFLAAISVPPVGWGGEFL